VAGRKLLRGALVVMVALGALAMHGLQGPVDHAGAHEGPPHEHIADASRAGTQHAETDHDLGHVLMTCSWLLVTGGALLALAMLARRSARRSVATTAALVRAVPRAAMARSPGVAAESVVLRC